MILRCKFTVEDYVAAYRTFAHRGARLWMRRVCLFAGIGSLLFGVWLTTLPKGSFSLALPMFLISLDVAVLREAVVAIGRSSSLLEPA